MTAKLPDYWPEGAAYKTPPQVPTLLPICPSCSARHRGPTPNCPFPNTDQESDHDDATG